MRLPNVFSKRNRILLRELIVTDFKLRYQGSALGYAWSILKPLFLFVILYIIFERFLKLGRDIEHFPVYLLTGVVLWQFFTESTIQGLQSIVNRGELIRKVNFPKAIIVMSGTVSALINLAINLLVVLLFCVVNGVQLRPEAILVIPLVAQLYIFSLAIAFFLAAINVKFRDVGYLWEIFLQAAFYATPIIYPIQMVIAEAPEAAKWLLLNPVTQIIQDIRQVLVTPQTIQLYDLVHGWKVVIPFAIVVVAVVVASWYFKRTQKYFAEQI